MKNFAKSILNYFAAFSETRFRFNRKLLYEWSDDSYTLDLSVFPEFQAQLLESISQGSPFQIEIQKGEHTVELDSLEIKSLLLEKIKVELNQDFLQESINQAKERLTESDPDEDSEELEKRALPEGLRQYNLTFRKLALGVLTEVQSKKLNEMQAKLGFNRVPPSSFNPQREVQRLFDDLQGHSRNSVNIDDYLPAVISYIKSQSFDYTMFDLHPVLIRYLQFIGTQVLYVFIHEIGKRDQKYPLFSIEIEMRDGDQRLEVISVRNVIMLNTPAINSFEFDTVLTTPRACRFEDSVFELLNIERFLQAKFNVNENFLLRPLFRPLSQKGLPTVQYRIGLQAVKEDDRRILDYSELITSLDHGAGNKFIDMISRYVDGNVQSTVDDVQQDYLKKYPKNSTERLIPKRLIIPLNLNEKQKKILTAVENPKNEIIVVDGPPGTGKSYTIAAIVYLANQLGKSVIITSHKKQALDVIDQTLTEQFKTLHPRSKPSVLRLERTRGPASLNNIENTLSSQVINAARTRSQEVNREAVENDRAHLYEQIDKTNNEFWKSAVDYSDKVQKTFTWVQAAEALMGAEFALTDFTIPKLPNDLHIDIDRLKNAIVKVADSALVLSIKSLNQLFADRFRLPEIIKKCEQLNQLGEPPSGDMINKAAGLPEDTKSFERLIHRLSGSLEKHARIADIDFEGLNLSTPEIFDGDQTPAYDALSEAKNQLIALVEIEKKPLGKLFKSKEIDKIKQDLKATCPALMKKIETEKTRPVLDRVSEVVDYVEKVRSEYPFVLKDYLLNGYRQIPSVELQGLLGKLSSLEFNSIVSVISDFTGKDLSELSLAEIEGALNRLQSLGKYLKLKADVQLFADQLGQRVDDLPALYNALKQADLLVNNLDADDIAALKIVFKHYQPLLIAIQVNPEDISSLCRFNEDAERSTHFFRFIQIHGELSEYQSISPPDRDRYSEFFAKSQKLLGLVTDSRLSKLMNHAADVQRIQTAIAAGKRISVSQAQVLLDNLACIISDPGLISQHFPMEDDLIDLLVIDEASQVSIAESISLMLRARQTIVFGDELQYGAVGAVNVSQIYSTFYFKDILHNYATDRKQAIPEEEKDRIAREASEAPAEDEEESSRLFPVDPATREWLKTFSVRTSTLAFAKALRNYSESLNVHFRSFPEIISYSNEYFYKESQIELIANRIRTKPIQDVLRFIKVDTQGLSGRNVNLDEIEAIQHDLENVVRNGYQGTIGIICSFREQAARVEEIFRKELIIYPDLVRNHKFSVWFVGDVQGEERDMVYYSFVQDKKIDNSDLRTIYPIIGGTADNIRRLKMQRLNVGFSRAKDIMVFVHSMPIGDYSDTRLGDALRYYQKILNEAHDLYVKDENVFDSPAEKELYRLILQTDFFQKNRERLRLVAQFEIGKYIREEYHRNIPKYRVDFLLTLSDAGKEKSLIIEYDGVEFHTKNPDIVTRHNFDQEYLEYDAHRQLELESYGYSFLRINKFTLMPRQGFDTPRAVLNDLLGKSFI
jgi:very-short-patch-repair endonuclease